MHCIDTNNDAICSIVHDTINGRTAWKTVLYDKKLPDGIVL